MILPNVNPVLLIREDSGFSLSGTALADLLLAFASRHAHFTLQAKGFSMSPLIKDGDVLSLSTLNGDFPRIGDVVAFIHPQFKRVYIHRIIAMKDKLYILKGDNNLHVDGLVSLSSILGRVNRVDRDYKRILVGLGPERLLVAFLSRKNLIPSILPWARKMIALGRYGRQIGIKFFNGL